MCVEKHVVVSCGLNIPNDNVQNNNKEKYEGLEYKKRKDKVTTIIYHLYL